MDIKQIIHKTRELNAEFNILEKDVQQFQGRYKNILSIFNADLTGFSRPMYFPSTAYDSLSDMSIVNKEELERFMYYDTNATTWDTYYVSFSTYVHAYTVDPISDQLSRFVINHFIHCEGYTTSRSTYPVRVRDATKDFTYTKTFEEIIAPPTIETKVLITGYAYFYHQKFGKIDKTKTIRRDFIDLMKLTDTELSNIYTALGSPTQASEINPWSIPKRNIIYQHILNARLSRC